MIISIIIMIMIIMTVTCYYLYTDELVVYYVSKGNIPKNVRDYIYIYIYIYIHTYILV